MKVKLLSRVQLFATPWTAAYQAPPSMGFSRQEYWSGVPSPSLESEVTQLYPILYNPVDCNLPGFPVHGIFQARVPEWVAFSFSRGSSQPRDQTQISHITGRCFTLWATREAWSRMDTCICIAKLLCCASEIITTLLIGHAPI